MGQTLTHGIYLPDEGERNCYNGLASNWSILDGSVGTIAAHTSALAGKAPLVHTHTKSNVTDLLNSNFIPSANNSYDLGSSSYQWNNLYAKKVNTQSLNGVNPGALSLPNSNAQDASWIGDLTIKDGSGYNLKTFTLNGWVTINIPNTAGNLIVVNNGCGQIVTNEAKGVTGNNCSVFIPVVANVQISILLVLQTGESVKTAIFAPCLGNV